jgi:hypothetical protein
MKLNQFITGCALAAGLMAFAPQSQAGIVYDKTLFSPLNITATFTFDISGKTKRATGTDKDILKSLNYPSGTVLAYYDGDVYAVNVKDGYADDLTAYGEVYVSLYETSYSATYPKSGGYIYNESGYLYVDFFSNADDVYLDDNDAAFTTEGDYTYVWKESAVKNTIYSVSQSMKTSNLTGDAYIYDYGYTTAFSAKASIKGSGKLLGP